MEKMVLGVFAGRVDAQEAINELEDRGYSPQDISIVMRSTERQRETGTRSGSGVAGGMVSGATTGGAIGALAGVLVATGIIPGLGMLLVGGPLAAALGLAGAAAVTISGAATGILAGGLIGALTNWGVPEEEAHVYENSIREGGILLLVFARLGGEEEVQRVLEDFGAFQIKMVEHTEVHDYAQREGMTSGEEYYGHAGHKGGEVENKEGNNSTEQLGSKKTG